MCPRLQALTRELFIDNRIDSAPDTANANNDLGNSRMSRRQFCKHVGASGMGMVLGCAASQIPLVQASDALPIPKLSYDPTLDQLKTDSSLLNEMLIHDTKYASNQPTTGTVAVGFDDHNVDAILSLQVPQKPYMAFINMGFDGKPPATHSSDADDFTLDCTWHLDKTGADEKNAYSLKPDGRGGWKPGPTPDGFRWDAAFDLGKNVIEFYTQTPNSAVGPGSSGLYGMMFLTAINDSLNGSGYPYDGTILDPSTYGPFRTEQSIDVFPRGFAIPTAAVSITAALLAIRSRRIREVDNKA
jgi:hypothetical protein